MSLPRPGASRIENLVATMLLVPGNGSHSIDLARVAKHQGFDEADLRAAFTRAETALSLTPQNCVIPEGE